MINKLIKKYEEDIIQQNKIWRNNSEIANRLHGYIASHEQIIKDLKELKSKIYMMPYYKETVNVVKLIDGKINHKEEVKEVVIKDELIGKE